MVKLKLKSVTICAPLDNFQQSFIIIYLCSDNGLSSFFPSGLQVKVNQTRQRKGCFKLWTKDKEAGCEDVSSTTLIS